MKYVVTRPFRDSNIGSNLSSLAGALWLARTLSRSLLVDWRGLSQLADPAVNYFPTFFVAPEVMAGIPVSYAPADVAGDYDSLVEGGGLSPAEAQRLVLARSEPAQEPLLLQTYHGLDRLHPGPAAERWRFLRRVYAELRPSEEVRAAAESWWDEQLGGAFVIGVNVRTGNGHYFAKGMRYASRVDISVFEDERRFIAKLERACRDRVRRLPREIRESFAIFYATDSAEMSRLLARLPNAHTRRAVFPPPGTGDTYCFDGDGYSDRDSIVDTLADMVLLARCDALVYNNSLFNQYARVLTGSFSGNLVQFESLFPSGKARALRAFVERGVRRALS